MSQTKFLTAPVSFNGDDTSTLVGNTSIDFLTDIQDLTACIQSWKIQTGSDRTIRNFDIQIDNIQKNGTTASCQVTLTLAATDSKWGLKASSCSIDIVFIAICD